MQLTRAECEEHLYGGKLPRAVGVVGFTSATHDGFAQRLAPPLANDIHVRAAVSQQPHDIGVEELRCYEQGCAPGGVRVVDGGVGGTLEDHPHDVSVPAPGRLHEGRCLVTGTLEG